MNSQNAWQTFGDYLSLPWARVCPWRCIQRRLEARMAITPYRLSANLDAIFCQQQSGPNVEVTPNANTSYATVNISGCNSGRSHWPPSHDYPVCWVALRPGLMYQGLWNRGIFLTPYKDRRITITLFSFFSTLNSFNISVMAEKLMSSKLDFVEIFKKDGLITEILPWDQGLYNSIR